MGHYRGTTITELLKCWRCGATLQQLSLPLARRDECPGCLAELHVCKQCIYFDPTVTKACREDDAEEVKGKDRANFCDYFKPSSNAFRPGFKTASAQAEAQLASLFGDPDNSEPGSADDPAGELDDLFKN